MEGKIRPDNYFIKTKSLSSLDLAWLMIFVKIILQCQHFEFLTKFSQKRIQIM